VRERISTAKNDRIFPVNDAYKVKLPDPDHNLGGITVNATANKFEASTLQLRKG